jgi:hypothetical protein
VGELALLRLFSKYNSNMCCSTAAQAVPLNFKRFKGPFSAPLVDPFEAGGFRPAT